MRTTLLEPMTPTAAASHGPNQTGRWSPVCRAWAYAVLLIVVAGQIVFHRLGDSLLEGDESTYALVFENMRASGDWIHPQITSERAHFHKPPLYYWLSATTYDLLATEASPLPYRFWSALFAIGCAVLVLVLGTMLASPEVGLLGGLILITNRFFLFSHGARYGGFDVGLTFFLTLAIVLYAWQRQAGRPLLVWALVGVALAAACLMKPLIVGCFFLGAIGLHHLLSRCEMSWRQRLVGPMLAGSIAIVLAAPWHLAQLAHWGAPFFEAYFLDCMVRRATVTIHADHAQGWGYYFASVPSSSAVFAWIWPAAALTLVCSFFTARRWLWSLTGISVAYFLAISSATSKLNWYPHPCLPWFALLLAAALVHFVPRIVGLLAPSWRWLPMLTALGAIALVVRPLKSDLRHYIHTSNNPRSYLPLQRYRELLPEIENGTERLVLFQFPGPDDIAHPRTGLKRHATFYARFMPQAIRVATPAELTTVLADGRPAVVIMPPQVTVDSLQDAWATVGRSPQIAAPAPPLFYHELRFAKDDGFTVTNASH